MSHVHLTEVYSINLVLTASNLKTCYTSSSYQYFYRNCCRHFLHVRYIQKKATRINLLFIHLCISDLLVICLEIPVRNSFIRVGSHC